MHVSIPGFQDPPLGGSGGLSNNGKAYENYYIIQGLGVRV